MSFKVYEALLRRWVRISRSGSYYHREQPVGTRFERGRVAGYYNDLTAKVEWTGETDEGGVPVNVLTNGERVYFPIGIAQMALGAHDVWLETGRDELKSTFMTLAGWLARHQDERGGWDNHWRELRPSCVSDYSAMAQGEAISVLVRAHLLAGDGAMLEAARRAGSLLVRPVADGGCAVHEGERLYLEEYPERPRSTVLNGWIFAVFGLYDLSLVAGDEVVKGSLTRTLRTLEEDLAGYDTGYWSYYDAQGALAAPFYHRLHTALLDALHALTDSPAFARYSERWKEYEKSKLNKSRAVAVKVWQKLKNPQKVMIAR